MPTAVSIVSTMTSFLKREKRSLDLVWIKDKSLTDADALSAPDVFATEIVDDLEAALEQFTKVSENSRQ